MSNITVAIDFDGVITNPHVLKSEQFAREGYDVASTETDREYCLETKNIPKPDYERVSRAVNVDRLNEVPIRDGAKDALRTMVAQGVTPVVVTSRCDDEVAPMREFIGSHDLPIHECFNTGRESKTAAVERCGADAFVDDSYSKLVPFIKAADSLSLDLYYFRNQANGHVERVDQSVTVVESWKKLLQEIF